MDLLTEIENSDISQLHLIDVTDNKKILHDSCYELEIKDPNEIILANYNGKKYVYDIIDRLPPSELNKLANKYGTLVYKDRSETIKNLKCRIYNVDNDNKKILNYLFYTTLLMSSIIGIISIIGIYIIYITYLYIDLYK